jgi:AbrB family looped-hinge helix DNA binding protein
MYESITVVGERGQITIPKTIREIDGIKPKDKLIVKKENGKIIVEKVLGKKEKEELMKEYYTKYAERDKQINKEWEVVDKEANRFLD